MQEENAAQTHTESHNQRPLSGTTARKRKKNILWI